MFSIFISHIWDYILERNNRQCVNMAYPLSSISVHMILLFYFVEAGLPVQQTGTLFTDESDHNKVGPLQTLITTKSDNTNRNMQQHNKIEYSGFLYSLFVRLLLFLRWNEAENVQKFTVLINSVRRYCFDISFFLEVLSFLYGRNTLCRIQIIFSNNSFTFEEKKPLEKSSRELQKSW